VSETGEAIEGDLDQGEAQGSERETDFMGWRAAAALERRLEGARGDWAPEDGETPEIESGDALASLALAAWSGDEERALAAIDALRAQGRAHEAGWKLTLGARTPLGLAAGMGRQRVVEALVTAGVADGEDGEGLSALARAAMADQAGCCLALLRADPEAGRKKAGEGWGGMTPLTLAAAKGAAKAVAALLPFSDPEATTDRSVGARSALSWAADGRDAAGAAECVRLLLGVSDPSRGEEGARGGCTPLMRAASRGNARAVASLLLVSDPLAADREGVGAAQLSAWAGSVECLAMIAPFLAPGGGSEAREAKKKTAREGLLEAAASGGCPRCMELAIPLAEWESEEECAGDTLFLATRAGALGVARAVAESFAEAARDESRAGRLALAAAESGDEATLRWALGLPGASARASGRGREGGEERTPLMLACEAGWLEGARILLPASDPHETSSREMSALAYAADAGSLPCVQLLLEPPSGPSRRLTDIEKAAQRAAWGGWTDCARLLAGRLARELPRALEGAIDKAIEGDRVETARALIELSERARIERGEGGNEPRAACSTVLLAADWAVVKALLPACRLDALDSDGATALHWLAERKDHCEQIALFALERGAAAARDRNGRTPLMRAAWSGNEELVEFLLPRCDPNERDDSGFSAVWAAIERRRWSVVERLLALGVSIESPPGMHSAIEAVVQADFQGEPEAAGVMRALIARADARESNEQLAAALLLAAGRENNAMALALAEALDAEALLDRGQDLLGRLFEASAWAAIETLSQKMPRGEVAQRVFAALGSRLPKTVALAERDALAMSAGAAAGAAQSSGGRRL
jgi:hypothetical protein